MSDEDKGLRLEDWIGKKVTVSLLTDPADAPEERVVQIEGFLEGIDPMGIIVLFGRGGVHTGSVAQPDVPRHVFYPWRRIQLVERIEGD